MPEEVQVYLGSKWPIRERGVLKCLQFSNRVKDRDGSAYQWLTFGLFYDIIEQAWFRPLQEKHFFLAKLNFPYAYTDRHEGRSTGNYDLRLLKHACRERLGGPSRLLIQFYNATPFGPALRGRGRPRSPTPPEPLIHEYIDCFKSGGLSLTNIQWDEEIELPPTPVRTQATSHRLNRQSQSLVLVLNNY